MLQRDEIVALEVERERIEVDAVQSRASESPRGKAGGAPSL
jgi:hypothetical protein